ncbi:hypothetical protein HVC08_002259 [Salmonella enterica]|nr:hypothetical protein [Salmonella enterica]
MIKRKITRWLYLTVSASILFTAMILVADIAVEIYFYFYGGIKIEISISDILGSLKSGCLTGIITGSGICFLTKNRK